MKLVISLVALGASLTASGLAAAQPPDTPPSMTTSETMFVPPPAERPSGIRRLPAPTNAFELTIGTGYTQGFGSLQSGVGLPSVVSPGLGFDIGVGYRMSPRVAVLVSGQYSELNAERTTAARAFTGTLGIQYHFAPTMQLDPWAEIGAGYRVLLEDPTIAPEVITHGIQVARLRVGLDFRPAEAVALGPVIGGDANLFLFQDGPGLQTNIPDPRLSVFVFAGLQGRFDAGGSTKTRPPAVASR